MARLLQIVSLFLLISQVFSATTYYLQIIDRTGAALFKNSPANKVVISNFAFSTTQPFDLATGQRTGREQSTTFSINRTADAYSALLLEQQATGSLLKTVLLTAQATNPAGTVTTVLKYTLTNANLVNWSHGNASPSGVIESLSFLFQKLELVSGANEAVVDFNNQLV